MQISEMSVHIHALRIAYPNAWPKDIDPKSVIAVWYDNFGHISNELFAAAVKHAIATYDWPSIKDMWESVLTVSGVPSVFDVQESFRRMQARWHDREVPKYSMEDHPLVKKSIDAMGYPDDIAAMGSYANKNLLEVFNSSRAKYRDIIMQRKSVGILEQSYKQTLQITDGN